MKFSSLVDNTLNHDNYMNIFDSCRTNKVVYDKLKYIVTSVIIINRTFNKY